MTPNNRRRFQRILTASEVEGMSITPELLRQLRAQGIIPQIAGGSPETDDDDADKGKGKPKRRAKAGDDDDDVDDDDDDVDADDEEDDDEGEPQGKKKGKRDEDDDDQGGEFVRMPRSEVQRLRREAREARKREKQQAREERERQEKSLADQEKWKDLADQRQERIDELEGEVEALKMEGVKNERKGNIIKVAKRLGFEYPDDAHRYLDVDDMEDEASIESALKTVLRDRPKLKSKRRGSGAPIPGESDDDGKGGALTIEDVKKMSPKEVNERWEEVQAVLRSQEIASS